mgnify:CR=1 FL=1
MRWKSHVRCGAGEKIEIISKSYLSLSEYKVEMIKSYLKIITTKIDKTKYLQNNQVMEEAA